MHEHEYKGRRAKVLWNTRVKDDDGNEIFIERGSFRDYLNEEFWSAYRVYILTENMQCLPFSGGWAEQPENITKAINLFRVEQSRWEQEEHEKELAKARRKR